MTPVETIEERPVYIDPATGEPTFTRPHNGARPAATNSLCHIAANPQRTLSLCGAAMVTEPWCCDEPDPACGRPHCVDCDRAWAEA